MKDKFIALISFVVALIIVIRIISFDAQKIGHHTLEIWSPTNVILHDAKASNMIYTTKIVNVDVKLDSFKKLFELNTNTVTHIMVFDDIYYSMNLGGIEVNSKLGLINNLTRPTDIKFVREGEISFNYEWNLTCGQIGALFCLLASLTAVLFVVIFILTYMVVGVVALYNKLRAYDK